MPCEVARCSQIQDKMVSRRTCWSVVQSRQPGWADYIFSLKVYRVPDISERGREDKKCVSIQVFAGLQNSGVMEHPCELLSEDSLHLDSEVPLSEQVSRGWIPAHPRQRLWM